LLKSCPPTFLHVRPPGSASFFTHEPSHHHLFPTIQTRLFHCQRKRFVPLSLSFPHRIVTALLFPHHEEKPGVRDRAHPSANVVNWNIHQSPVQLRIWGCSQWVDRRPTGLQGAHSSSEDVDMLGGIKTSDAPPLRSQSPGPLAEDFTRQQIFKQSRGNFHSSSLTSSILTMVSNTVNKTALHPSGIQ